MGEFGRAVTRGSLALKRWLSKGAAHLRRGLSWLAAVTAMVVRTAWEGAQRVWEGLARRDARGRPYLRHSLPVRVMHWVNVFVLAVLLMSGLNIFNAHPALYWGRQSYGGPPAVLEITALPGSGGSRKGVTTVLGHPFDTTGWFGASLEGGRWRERGFPAWLTLPDDQWLAMARRWHLFFAWLLVVNGLGFVVHAVASGHLRRDLLPTTEDWRATGRVLVEHLLLRPPAGEEARRYNVLQKSAYLAVIFLLLPLMVLMGFGLSPALDALIPGWVDLFAGRQSIRTIHFVVAWGLVLFVGIHVFEVVVTGLLNNIRSMITGYYRIEPKEEP